MTQFPLGIVLVMAGGAFQGTMLWPMKLTKKWAWENTWLVFSVAAYLVAPWVLAVLTVPHLFDVLRRVGSHDLIMTCLYGIAWGVGNVLFGLGVRFLGMGLGYTITMGLTVSVGTLVPLLVLAPSDAFSRRGIVLYSGVLAVLLGIVLCSHAGSLREAKVRNVALAREQSAGISFARGLAICLAAGILVPGGNIAISFGLRIAAAARAVGASNFTASNVLLAVLQFPLFLCSVCYCLFLLSENRTFAKFRVTGTGHYWLVSALMGLLQMMGISLYGAGTLMLGRLGTSIGYSILMSSMIITATGLGVFSGEWRDSGRTPAMVMAGGLLILSTAIFVIGYGAKP